LVFGSWMYFYEGKGVCVVVYGVWMVVCAGCLIVVFINGCGGFDFVWLLGILVFISDYINFMVSFLLEGVIFVDFIDLYSLCLRVLCCEVEFDFDEGVYV